MTNQPPQVLSLSERILLGLVVLLSAHVGLSSLGFVPSEVSTFNQQITEAVRQLHTVKYVRKQSSQTVSFKNQVSADAPELPQAPTSSKSVGVNPDRIQIPKLDIDTTINNPTSTAIDTLDSALRDGVVRYPNSGRINGNKPMFLFGHSSRLPVVQNEAYKSFNGLDELSPGDRITVSGDDEAVDYRVQSVRVVEKDEAYVDFSVDSDILTLSTCSTFGKKENRVVVTARKL